MGDDHQVSLRSRFYVCVVANSLVLLLLLLVLPAGSSQPVRVLAIGSVSPVQSPVPYWLSLEPGVEYTLVPTRLYDVSAISPSEAKRMLRIYFPRTKTQLERYNCILFSGGDVRYFSPSDIEMLREAIRGGAGAATDMGGMSTVLYDFWIASGIWDVFPNDVLAVKSLWERGAPKDKSFQIEVNKQLSYNPLKPFVELGIERVLGGRTRIISPRQGSTVYAWTRSQSLFSKSLGFDPAASLVWSYGKGRTLAFEGWLGHSWWSSIIDPCENEYGRDILANYLMDVALGRYMANIPMAHAVRQSFADFKNQEGYVLSIFEFVERFGVNTGSLNKELGEAKRHFQLARQEYVEGNLEDALHLSRQSSTKLSELVEKALRMKDAALRWVYLTEWMVVAAVLMISGFVLEQIMMRRKLYRRVSSTRSS